VGTRGRALGSARRGAADTLDDLRARARPAPRRDPSLRPDGETFAAHGRRTRAGGDPREYVERALDSSASQRLVAQLTKLYERAKFSPHEIDEG
jgi:hypothetical protein